MKVEKFSYNLEEAAEYAKCDLDVIVAAIRNKHLTARWVTRNSPVVLREDLVQWIESHGSSKLLEEYGQLLAEKDKRIDELERELARLKETKIVNVYKPPAPKGQQVYFIRCEDFVKIGMSVDPQQRLKAIQVSGNGTHAPKNVDLSTSEVIATEMGGFDRESELHNKFAHLREVGEWFRVDDELTAYIDGLLAKTA